MTTIFRERVGDIYGSWMVVEELLELAHLYLEPINGGLLGLLAGVGAPSHCSTGWFACYDSAF